MSQAFQESSLPLVLDVFSCKVSNMSPELPGPWLLALGVSLEVPTGEGSEQRFQGLP